MTYTYKPAPTDSGCLMALFFAPFLFLGRRVAMRKHWTWTG